MDRVGFSNAATPANDDDEVSSAESKAILLDDDDDDEEVAEVGVAGRVRDGGVWSSLPAGSTSMVPSSVVMSRNSELGEKQNSSIFLICEVNNSTEKEEEGEGKGEARKKLNAKKRKKRMKMMKKGKSEKIECEAKQRAQSQKCGLV